MNVVALLVLWLFATAYSAKTIKEPLTSNELQKITEATVEIVSKCYEERVNRVGVAGNPKNVLLEALNSRQSIGVTVIGNDKNDKSVDRQSRVKLQLFAITASTSKQLKKTLKDVKSSKWWNHKATFIILDGSKNACANAFKFTWTAWEMNLLKATYVCLHRTKGILIYTYNPYTGNAPKSWHLEKVYKGKNNHPWTMFVREYDVDDKICESLDFDKTIDLGGYEIIASVTSFPPLMIVDSNKTSINSISGPFGHLWRTIFHAVNATVRLKVYDVEGQSGSDAKGNDGVMDTINGISDISLDLRSVRGLKNYTTSYPLYTTDFVIVTQHRGYKSQLQKLITVLDKSSRIGICLVVLTIVIFFKFLRQEPLLPAILNTIRIICYSGLTKVPTNQGARIFLTGVSILVVTIVGIYQGMLASLLTDSKPLKNVETLRDLAEGGYTIHCNKMYARSLMPLELKGRFVAHEDSACLKFVVDDYTAACVAAKVLVVDEAVRLKLHISSEIVLTISRAFVIRDDWPLEERFNKIFEAMNEAGIVEKVIDASWKKSESIVEFYKTMEENQKRRVMTLKDLRFAFVFLGIGLSISTVVFIIEVAVSPLQSRTRNLCTRIRNRFRFK